MENNPSDMQRTLKSSQTAKARRKNKTIMSQLYWKALTAYNHSLITEQLFRQIQTQTLEVI